MEPPGYPGRFNDAWDRRVWTGYAAYLNLQAGRLTTAAEIWENLDYDPASNTSPTLEAQLDFFYAQYLTAVGDSTAYDRFENARKLSADCGMTLAEHLVATFEVPLLIGQGDFVTAQQRIVKAVSEHIRTGSLLMLWMGMHSLARLLDETGRRDQALELWAELRDRDGWIDPEHRADLENRLGPPGQPKLTDDELVLRTKEIISQLV